VTTLIQLFKNPNGGQGLWNQLYAKAYLRMSIFGVNKINHLTDCTHVLPSQNPTFSNTTNGSCNTSSSSSGYSTPTSVTKTAYTTSTVYTTKTYTTFQCAEKFIVCLWWTPAVSSSTYPVATTVIPITPTPAGYSSKSTLTNSKTTTTQPPAVWWKE
jgi:hypothetical protein